LSELRAQLISQEKSTVNKVTELTTDLAEREQRSCNVIITRLPEESDEDEASLRAAVVDLFALTASAVHVQSARRLGKPVSGVAKSRVVCVRLASVQARNEVLRGRKHLRDSKYSTVGINEDLTKAQQELKKKAWPAFIKAKAASIHCYWRAEKLYIDQKEYCCP